MKSPGITSSICGIAMATLITSGLPAAGQGPAGSTLRPASRTASALLVCGISGEVMRPSSVPCNDGILLRDAIEAAGGLTSNADTGKITIVRGSRRAGSLVRDVKYDYRRVIEGKAEDVTLLPGELVVIPAKRKGVGFNLGRLLPPRQVQRDVEQFAKKNPVVTGAAVAALGAVAYNNLRPHHRPDPDQSDQSARAARYAAIEGGPDDPWRQFYANRADAERQRAAAQQTATQPGAVGGELSDTLSERTKRAQIAQLIEMMRVRAGAQAAQRGSLAPFDSTGGAQSMIARLNSMSQADVNRLMSQPSVWDQFTPYWYKRDGGNVLGRAGVPSGLMRDVSRLDNLFDSTAQRNIDRRLANVNRLAGVSAGMAAEQNVRNQVQKWDYKLMADRASSATKSQLIADEARLSELLKRLNPSNRP